MLSAILTIIHVLQAAFSSYNLYLAEIPSRNLQGYEETSKKTAEYSNIAEYQLHKTRTTQASGTLAVFLPSPQVYPKFTHKSGPPLTRELAVAYCVLSPSSIGKVVLRGVNMAALEGHIGEFWKGKKKVPLPDVGDYNETTMKTQDVRLNMAYLIFSWIATRGLSLML
jgi:hypothetical protein